MIAEHRLAWLYMAVMIVEHHPWLYVAVMIVEHQTWLYVAVMIVDTPSLVICGSHDC